MTPAQNIWVMLFNFGPAIFLAIYKSWWVGLLALVAAFVVSWLLVFLVSFRLPTNAMAAWAWLKPPLVATVVLSVGWFYF